MTGRTFFRLTEVQQPNRTATLSVSMSFFAFSGKTSVNRDCGSSMSLPICSVSAHPPLSCLEVPGEVMLHHGRRAADLERLHGFFDVPILVGDALVLAQMLGPGLHHERLDPPRRVGQVLEQAPVDRPV